MNKKVICGISLVIFIIIAIVIAVVITMPKENINVNNIEDLWEWPEPILLDEAVENNWFVVDNTNEKIYNKDVLDKFIENTGINSKNRVPDKIRIVVYNMNNEPAIYDIEYKIFNETYINEYGKVTNKTGYVLTIDNSRVYSLEIPLSYKEQIEYHKIKTNSDIPGSIYGITIIEEKENNMASVSLALYAEINNESEDTKTYGNIEIARYGLEWEIINAEKLSTYNNPKVPENFRKIETETASWTKDEQGNPIGWNNGLVIEDEQGNQFVWVPVQNRDFIKTKDEQKYLMDQEIEEELEQIEKYGGFYIARYEAGVSSEMQERTNGISKETNDVKGIPVSKQNTIPWNYISLKNAKINAKSMCENEEVRSDLVTTRQWLHVMEWLNETGYDIDNPKEYGNFVDSHFNFTGYYSIDYGKSYTYGEDKLKQTYNMILSTGATDRNITNNIYDLAGNLIEYTDGYVPDRGYYSVGGHFDTQSNYGIYSPRLIGVVPLEKLGFRVVLYMK